MSKRWMLVSGLVLGLAALGAWAGGDSCGRDGKGDEKKAKSTASGCEKTSSSCSKTVQTSAKAAECTKQEECADRMFGKIDANNDGRLDRSEFIAGMGQMVVACRNCECAETCAVRKPATVTLTAGSVSPAACDKDKTACDKKGTRDCPSKCPKTAATAVLSAFDADRDGKLGAEEIQRASVILAALVRVSEAEQKRLDAPAGSGCCPKSLEKASATSIDTLAGRTVEALQPRPEQQEQAKSEPRAEATVSQIERAHGG